MKSALEALESERKDLAIQTSEMIALKARLGVFTAMSASLEPASAAARKIAGKIREDEQKKSDLENKIVETTAKILAYEDFIDLLPDEDKPVKLREDSDMAKVEKYLISFGGAATLSDIVKNLNPEDVEKKKKSLRGSLRAYARAGKIFVLGQQPDTFGLRAWSNPTGQKTEKGGEEP